MKRKQRNILLSLIIVAIIIVVFPLISLRYLNEGLEYRRGQLETLEELGAIVSFDAENRDGMTLNRDEAIGKITIIAHELAVCDERNGGTIAEFAEKFAAQDAFRFMVIKNKGLCALNDYVFVAASDKNADLVRQFNDAIGRPSAALDHVVLVDRKGQVRRIYDMATVEDLESLVAHTTLLLPPLKKRG